MKQQISDFEKSRVALERLLIRSNVQLSKAAAQLTKKKSKHTGAAKTARTRKVALVADIAKKSTPVKKARLKKINDTIQSSSAEAQTLAVELKAVKTELSGVKAALSRYKAGFKAYDKAVNAQDKIAAKKASKKTVKRRVKRKSTAKK